MNILVTNDDGIRAPGIEALAEAAMPFGNISVIAPDSNRSACGHHKSLGTPLRVDPFPFPLPVPAFQTDGSPSDCTALAGLGFLDHPIDLVLSGFNPTCNVGLDITYSGTVTAALEAPIWGMSGIAFSFDAHKKINGAIDFTTPKKVAADVLKTFIGKQLPPYTILNVNIPDIPYEEIKGFQITRSGNCVYNDVLVRCEDPFHRPYYWFGGDFPTRALEPGMDSRAVADGYVSVTPLRLDLTAYSLMDEISQWNWEKTGE